MKRLGTIFHEGFPLNRSSVSQVVDLARTEAPLSYAKIREATNLGTNYVKAMPRYGVGTGLLKEKTYQLTPFGEIVAEHDPSLNHPATQWLMHYNLSAPAGPGPLFWHHLVSRELKLGQSFSRAEMIERLRGHLQQEKLELAERSLGTLATVFLGTYVKTDGLGKLGILAEDGGDESSQRYTVEEPDAPPVYALGYALAHYWEQQVNALRTDLSALSAPGGFADLFFLGTYQLSSALRALQREGYVGLEQIAPPHQLVKQWESKESFLERLYD